VLRAVDGVLCHLGSGVQIQQSRYYDGAVALLSITAIGWIGVLVLLAAGQLQRVHGSAGHSKTQVAACALAGLAVSGSATVCLLRRRAAGLVLGLGLAVLGLVTSTRMGNNPFGLVFNVLLLALLVSVARTSASLSGAKPPPGGPRSSPTGPAGRT